MSVNSPEGGETQKEPVVIKLPTDNPRLVEAILAKRTEYLGRIAEMRGGYTHPELAVMMSLAQGVSSAYGWQARAELITALEEAGDQGVDLDAFAESFVAGHPSYVVHPDESFRVALVAQAVEEGRVVQAYCEENFSVLSGGTGLQYEA